MNKFNSNQKVFFALVRAGLWGNGNPDVRIDEPTDWYEVYRLASEQSVPGLVLAGLEHSNVKPPKELLLQWIGDVQIIEQRNKEMNAFVADLIEKLRKEDVYAVLVKGQGIAQCYERPLWRACGDVDLFLDSINYYSAKSFLSTLSDKTEDENIERMHQGMQIGSWTVELHGSLRSGLWKKLDKRIDILQDDTFRNKQVRIWNNNGTEVILPNSTNDVLFVFTHILQHFFQEGIGLRQICDWCRLLWKYNSSIDKHILQSFIDSMGIWTEWQTFSSLVVNELGMPLEAMPLYNDTCKWRRKSALLLSCILRTGNFGKSIEDCMHSEGSFLKQKIRAVCRYSTEAIRHALIFPMDSISVWANVMKSGFCATVKRLITFKYCLS